MATYKDTNRSGRKICTMRHFSRVAMDSSPLVLTWRAGEKPTMANQVGRAPRQQCRLGYFPGGVDRPYGNKANVREIPTRRAALRDSPRMLSRRYFPSLAKRRPTGDEIAGQRWYRRPARVGASSREKKTNHSEPVRPRATSAASPWFFNRRSSLPIRETSELRKAAPPLARLLRSVLGGVFSFSRNRDRAF